MDLYGGWPDEACEGRDFWPWDAEAGADEFVERQFQLHAGFGKPQHDVARVAALVADGPAGDFSFRDEGADDLGVETQRQWSDKATRLDAKRAARHPNSLSKTQISSDSLGDCTQKGRLDVTKPFGMADLDRGELARPDDRRGRQPRLCVKVAE